MRMFFVTETMRSPGIVALAVASCLMAHAQTRQTVRAAKDLGRAGSDVAFSSLRITFKISAEKQAQLDALLVAQQDPTSPEFHKWLTPEEYGRRFATSDEEISAVSAWLKSQGMRSVTVARGRNAVTFNGSVAQVEKAFSTEIHRYSVDGETHFANATEPTTPTEFRDLIGSIEGLDDFRMRAPKPRYNSTIGNGHNIAPDDFATIFNVKPLYGRDINGAGQKVVVVGQTRITPSDLQLFRSNFGLSAKEPELLLVPNTKDPGISTPDLGEALLDIQWVGAVAREATIVYVYSDDVVDALTYAIDQNLAPVISMSYGLCEAGFGVANSNALRQYAQRAAAQGISWIAASGDAGAADCFDNTKLETLAVDIPAAFPEVTGIGGTRLNEGTGTYWAAQNDANKASALSYIPETAWNDSVRGNLSSSGGGLSSIFARPTWQTGTGVPTGTARAVPDVALPASAAHDGYLMYQSGNMRTVGGTSVGAPAFAGVIALLNQYQVANGLQTTAGMGNINPRLYAMASSVPNSFHDITTGDNIVDPCPSNQTSCTASKIGYSAGVGYDMVTGLGSLDAFNLVTAWGAPTPKIATSVTLTSSASTVPLSGSVTLTAVVAAADTGAPSGTVSFLYGSTSLGIATLATVGGRQTASLSLAASAFPAGSVSITARYSGDSAYSGSSASTSISVTSATSIVITGAVNAASYQPVAAPGMILAVFGALMAGSSESAPVVPLPTTLAGVTATINGALCPLYYASPSQINLQVPYVIAPGTATLRINYNDQVATRTITVSSAAPGVFTNPNVTTATVPVPDQSAARGQTITLFITGEGALTPAATAGSLPAAGTIPRALQGVSVTVGGTTAALSYAAVPAWSIGATQINYTIPPNAPLGPNTVVVSVGGFPSAPVTVNVTQ